MTMAVNFLNYRGHAIMYLTHIFDIRDISRTGLGRIDRASAPGRSPATVGEIANRAPAA